MTGTGENKKHQQKLNRIGKQLDELMVEIKKEFPDASLHTLDCGGLYVLDGNLNSDGVNSLGDLDVIYYAPCFSIDGGAV